MERPKRGFKGWLQNWQSDLGAGLAVALIALPLSMSLAMASEVPPMAGVIAAVVGGITVAVFGGSHVTITGPGNGLIIVIISAVTTLGAGDMLAGYYYTLAAVVVSGLILIAFGYLRLGVLGNFFPSSAIKGLLAAIGVLFIANQFHIMIGIPVKEGASNIEMLLDIPSEIGRLFDSVMAGESNYVALIGILSLAIMAFYPMIKLKAISKLPAPILVVLMAIGFYYYFEWFSSSPYPVGKEHLIFIPEDVTNSFAFPDFGKVFTLDFLYAVIGITLIISVESLLSIKAVDQLDPFKRRSNVDRDLKALGLGSVLSGMIGGLPVVTVIARSSVNVHNGAKTRGSNFFHGLILLIIIFVFQDILKKIPLSALAGILVFTGYKLARPKVFKSTYEVGKEQLLIALATLFATLVFGLIWGMCIGILVTLIVQFFLIHPKSLVLRAPWHPNTLMYQEDEGKFYVGVKGFSNFMNYLQLKKQLDSIPFEQHVILDFSLTNFVDHNVMEHIEDYMDDYQRRGGEMEIVGLDVHTPSSPHPFAARKVSRHERSISPSKVFTSRQKALKKFADEVEWNFLAESIYEFPEIEEFPLIKTKVFDHVYNSLQGKEKDIEYKLFDIEYYEGEFIAKKVFRSTMLLIQLEQKLPEFTLDKEGLFHRVADLMGFSDINMEEHPDFSKRFLLRGDDEEAIRKFFTKELVLFFESNPYYHVQSDGKSLLVFKKERLASISEVKALISFGTRLAHNI